MATDQAVVATARAARKVTDGQRPGVESAEWAAAPAVADPSSMSIAAAAGMALVTGGLAGRIRGGRVRRRLLAGGGPPGRDLGEGAPPDGAVAAAWAAAVGAAVAPDANWGFGSPAVTATEPVPAVPVAAGGGGGRRGANLVAGDRWPTPSSATQFIAVAAFTATGAGLAAPVVAPTWRRGGGVVGRATRCPAGAPAADAVDAITGVGGATAADGAGVPSAGASPSSAEPVVGLKRTGDDPPIFASAATRPPSPPPLVAFAAVAATASYRGPFAAALDRRRRERVMNVAAVDAPSPPADECGGDDRTVPPGRAEGVTGVAAAAGTASDVQSIAAPTAGTPNPDTGSPVDGEWQPERRMAVAMAAVGRKLPPRAGTAAVAAGVPPRPAKDKEVVGPSADHEAAGATNAVGAAESVPVHGGGRVAAESATHAGPPRNGRNIFAEGTGRVSSSPS